jgi:regulator of protease activity HflC (stomatin/prohibitin superfamily)
MLDRLFDILIWCFKKLPHFYTLPPDESAAVLRFGKYLKTYNKGGHYIFHWPVIHRILPIVVTRQLIDIDMQDIMTMDHKTITLNASIEYVVTDPRKALLSVNDYDENIQEMGGDIFRHLFMSNKMEDIDIEAIIKSTLLQLSEKAQKYGVTIIDVYVPTFTNGRAIRLIS